jgi:hypothetical protein
MKKTLSVVIFALIFLFTGTTGAQNSPASANPRPHAYYAWPEPCFLSLKGLCPPFPTCPTGEPCLRQHLNTGLDAKTQP